MQFLFWIFFLFEHFFYRNFKSNTARDIHRKHYTNGDSNIIPKTTKQENRGTGTHTFSVNENDIIRPSTSFQETRHAAGRSSYDTHIFDKRPPVRPHTSMNDCKYFNI
jgi:hypothetical protein